MKRAKYVMLKNNHGGARRGAGRPAWKPARQRKEISSGEWRDETLDEAWEGARKKVQDFAAIGYPQEIICRLIEPPMRCADTLRAYFKVELENGRFIADARVAQTLYLLCVTGRDPASARLWLRARMGWRDVGRVKNSVPLQFQRVEGND